MDRIKKMTFIQDQLRAADLMMNTMPCGCGGFFTVIHMHQCLSCGEWYCPRCAEIHFGKTRKQYQAEKEEQDHY